MVSMIGYASIIYGAMFLISLLGLIWNVYVYEAPIEISKFRIIWGILIQVVIAVGGIWGGRAFMSSKGKRFHILAACLLIAIVMIIIDEVVLLDFDQVYLIDTVIYQILPLCLLMITAIFYGKKACSENLKTKASDHGGDSIDLRK